jgi:acid phosphatase
VLLQVGDNLGDFVSDVSVDPAARQVLVENHADYWGRRWIVLPNPQYGSWDGALIDFQFGIDRDAKRARKLGALEPLREIGHE